MMDRISAKDYQAIRAAHGKARKRNKFGAVRTTIDGVTYDSKAEAAYIMELRLLERSGLIKDLRTQVVYRFIINGIDCGSYVADAVFYDRETRKTRTIDVKGGDATKTPLFKLKAKLMFALHGITVECVG